MSYKKRASAKSYPFRIRPLHQSTFSWSVADDFSSLTLTDFTIPTNLASANMDAMQLGLYAWDSSQEAFNSCSLSTLELPFSLSLENAGLVSFTSRPYFKVVIFDQESKKFLFSSRNLLLGNEQEQVSLLPIYPKRLGRRIAQLEITDDGPTIYVSQNFMTQSGLVPFPYLRKLLVEDPSLASGIWPVLLDQIVRQAYSCRVDSGWARDWLKYVESIVQGAFDHDSFDLVNGEDNLEQVILEFVDKWIAHEQFDKRLYLSAFPPST
jgi:hypothetical protein